jgi:hypothetical protein
LRRFIIVSISFGCAWDACWMRVQAVHGVAIRSGDEVAVDIDRHLHGAVPELLLHVGQGFPLLNQQTGKGVPQVVETDASKFRPLCLASNEWGPSEAVK